MGLCKICKNILSRKDGIHCRKHRNLNGKNNPFYGKTHTKETIDKSRIKIGISSKIQWQDPEYRDRVIRGISKPRREGFKKEQSDRIIQWYIDNPEQKELRSKAMKKSWNRGIIVKNPHSINCSKGEKELLKTCVDLFPSEKVRKATLRIGNRWLYPDILINDSHIIEYNGDYWHANPRIYDRSYKLNSRVSAGDVWEADIKRNKLLKSAGFNIFTVWDFDYKKDRLGILKEIKRWFYNTRKLQKLKE